MEFPLNRFCGNAKRLSDFSRGVALEPPQGDHPQRRFFKAGEKSAVIIGELGGFFRRWLPAQDFRQPVTAGNFSCGHGRLTQQSPAAALLPVLAAKGVERLADRDGPQQPPEVISSAQLRELAPARTITETLKRAQGHVLRVERPAPMRRPRSGLDDGRVVTPDLFRATLDDEMKKVAAAVGAKAFEGGRFAEAIRLFSDMSLSPTFEEFLTLPAYRLID